MNVNQAIYNCRICNETAATHYRCDCDMGVAKPKHKPPVAAAPLPPLPETPEVNSLRGLLVIPVEDLPGDYVGRMQAIEKILTAQK